MKYDLAKDYATIRPNIFQRESTYLLRHLEIFFGRHGCPAPCSAALASSRLDWTVDVVRPASFINAHAHTLRRARGEHGAESRNDQSACAIAVRRCLHGNAVLAVCGGLAQLQVTHTSDAS